MRFLQDGEYLKFAANGAANLILCIWAVYLAEAAVTKIFPERGDALDDDMMKEEAMKNAAGDVPNSAEGGNVSGGGENRGGQRK